MKTHQIVPGQETRAKELAADHGHEVGAKCSECYAMPSVWTPFAGAQSFDAYDSFTDANERSAEVSELQYVFEGITANIMADPSIEIAEKARRVATAAADLAARVTKIRTDAAEADAMAGESALREPASEAFPFRWSKDFTYVFAGEKAAGALMLEASDFAHVPDATDPATWSLPLIGRAHGDYDLPRIGAAIKALDTIPATLRRQKSVAISRIASAITLAPGTPEQRGELAVQLAQAKAFGDAGDPGTLWITKDAAGAYRWVTVHSNVYRDREGEAFTAEAHKDYVDWVDANPAERMPELRVWHVPGSRLGRADVLDFDGAFVIASGTFDAGKELHAERLAAMKGMGCSHGYNFKAADRRDGVYTRYRDFEISVLPSERAANELTAFSAGRESLMLTPAKKDTLAAIGGPEWAGTLEKALEDLRQNVEAKGFEAAYKDFEDAIAAAPAPAAAATTDPAPAATATDPAPAATADPAPADAAAAKDDLGAQIMAAVTTAIAPLQQQVAEIATKQTATEAAVKALGESEDSRIAAYFAPRRPLQGFRASEESEPLPADDARVKEASAIAPSVPSFLGAYFNADGTLRTPASSGGAAPASVPAAV